MTATGQVSIVAWPTDHPVWGVFSAKAYDPQDRLIAGASGNWTPADLALSGAMVPLGTPGAFLKAGPCLPGLTLSPLTGACTTTTTSPSAICDARLNCLSEISDELHNAGCLYTASVQPPPGYAAECAQFCNDQYAPCPPGQSCRSVGQFNVCRY
jgi:hypothetical protein